MAAKSNLEEAIRLNNEGVSRALNGDDAHAIASFSRSLSVFKQIIAFDDFDGDESGNYSPTQLHSYTSALPKYGKAEQEHFYLFRNVIALRPRLSSEPLRTIDHHVYCSVIILNLAVLHQQKALKGESPSNALTKAERFYDMVVSILSCLDHERAANFHATALVARLAAFNNVAYIRLQIGNYSSSERCFQMVAWLVNNGANSGIDQSALFCTSASSVSENVVEGMMLNVLMANRQTTAAAA